MTRSAAIAIVLLTLPIPCQAQSQTASGRGVDPVRSFLRVADRIGQALGVFRTGWPPPLDDNTSRSELRLTAADRLIVFFDGSPPMRDASAHLHTVQLWRDLPDTLALRRVVTSVQALLVTRYGPPLECSDPLGDPSHLYQPQTVSRFWTKGPQGVPLELTWTVAPDGRSGVQLSAGSGARDATVTLRCDAQMP